MIVFPNCKINLGLHILRKRTDGFHDLETVFYPVPLTDALEIIRTEENRTTFSHSGIELNIAPSENICLKAVEMLREDFPQIPQLKIHLHKVIPHGAGLGGGSADGAFTLKLLNRQFHLELSEEQLIAYALRLGSDCPFFIRNRACFATGRGEKMRDVALDLSGYDLVLVNPRIHVNTGWAFSQIRPTEERPSLEDIVLQPVSVWKEQLRNDFEPVVMAAHPEVRSIRDALYDAGAQFAAMSGTGSTVFALFEKNNIPQLDFPEDYFIAKLPLGKN